MKNLLICLILSLGLLLTLDIAIKPIDKSSLKLSKVCSQDLARGLRCNNI